MADTGCLGLITGQIIGRWGNFFNCEAFGGYTESLLAMRIKKSIVNPSMISQDLLQNLIVENGVEYIQVHPTFLYEDVYKRQVFINTGALVPALKPFQYLFLPYYYLSAF